MASTINKDFLKNYRFSDKPNAWVLEAKNFKRSAELLLESVLTPKKASKFISMPDASSNHMCIKTVCYLYSVSIELFLKGIYSAVRTDTDLEKTESFGHDVERLVQKLTSKGVFKKNAPDRQILTIANIILEWSGRYHRPNPKEIDKVIEACFEQVPNQPEMVKPKFNSDQETAKKLGELATALYEITPVNPGSIDHLIFLPF